MWARSGSSLVATILAITMAATLAADVHVPAPNVKNDISDPNQQGYNRMNTKYGLLSLMNQLDAVETQITRFEGTELLDDIWTFLVDTTMDIHEGSITVRQHHINIAYEYLQIASSISTTTAQFTIQWLTGLLHQLLGLCPVCEIPDGDMLLISTLFRCPSCPTTTTCAPPTTPTTEATTTTPAGTSTVTYPSK